MHQPSPLPDDFLLGIRLESIFMPHARKRRNELYQNGAASSARFVHYTSAEAALSIIRTKRIWMRNTMCMSDYSEVQHGYGIIQRYFSDPDRAAAFATALDIVSPNIGDDAVKLFDQWSNFIRYRTYIASIAEHDSNEDTHGRLSIWRAFGGDGARVAIVLRVPWYTGSAEQLKVMFSPVAYMSEQEVHRELEAVIANVKAEAEFLRSVPRDRVVSNVFTMLLAAVTCLKHEGFVEEREWRAIYSPSVNKSALVESGVEIISGIPQIVYRLPLDANKASELSGLDFTRLFDRLIIGPSQFALPMSEAFVAALARAGVKDAADRVFRSGTPIRS